MGDTCQWILKRTEFETWITSQESPILLISGNSGVGKSHLAASIARHLRDQIIMGDGGAFKASFASYFCDFEDPDSSETLGKSTIVDNESSKDKENQLGRANEPSSSLEAKKENEASTEDAAEPKGGVDRDSTEGVEAKSLSQMLRTLAWQLTQGDKAYEKYLAARKKEVGTVDQIWGRLFNNKYFEELQKPVFLVIDSFDTLPSKDRKAFYNLLKDLAQVKEGETKLKLKIAILGRPRIAKEIRKVAEEPQLLHVTVSKTENGQDIETFITRSLTEPRKLHGIMKDKNFREEIVTKLGEAADGGFERAHLSALYLISY